MHSAVDAVTLRTRVVAGSDMAKVQVITEQESTVSMWWGAW